MIRSPATDRVTDAKAIFSNKGSVLPLRDASNQPALLNCLHACTSTWIWMDAGALPRRSNLQTPGELRQLGQRRSSGGSRASVDKASGALREVKRATSKKGNDNQRYHHPLSGSRNTDLSHFLRWFSAAPAVETGKKRGCGGDTGLRICLQS
jgi:hypothetical protein